MSRTVLPLLVALFTVLGAPAALAQSTPFEVYPGEIYPGRNIITVGSPAGIRHINVLSTSGELTVSGDDVFDCDRERDVVIDVARADAESDVVLEIIDCRERRHTVRLAINNVWLLDDVRFPAVPAGERRCMMFRIEPRDEAAILDSVSVADPRVSLRFFSDLPVRIGAGLIYTYEVCFDADEPGLYRFPVVTHMRRRQPAGGYTNYPVSDTGFVFIPEPLDAPVTDPTTFRSVAVPNAVIPPEGSLVFGSYDVLGLLAGYSVSDNLMIMGGGALPLPDDWGGVRGQMFGAVSIGAKAGMPLTGRLDAAVGYQFGASVYDEERSPGITESAITVHAPWAAISYGTDDARASITVGYAMKHHTKPEIEFDENALIVAAGGDYRFAHNWKVAGEVAYMETLGVVPIIATARYFTNSYAIDAGVGFAGITVDGGVAPKVPLLPVVSAVFVF